MRLIFGGVVPRRVFIACAFITVLTTILTSYVSLQLPWLGMELAPAANGKGLVVKHIDADSPNAAHWHVGDTLVSVTAKGETRPLHAYLLTEDPDVLPPQTLAAFISEQGWLASVIDGSPVVTTATGKAIPLSVMSRPINSLFNSFSLLSLYAYISFFIALGIWSVRPQQLATRIFGLSGIGVLLSLLPLAVYSGRDLIIDADLYETLSLFNVAGTLLEGAALVSLFWVYPRPLGRHPVRVPILLFILYAMCWLLTWAGVSSMRYTVYLPVFMTYVLGFSFAGMQWYVARYSPLDRAALKWCLLALVTCTLFITGLFAIPPLLGAKPIVSSLVGQVGFPLMYLGMAAGLVKYRLFDIERWWFKTWLWFFAGLLMVVFDLLLVYGINMNTSTALLLSLALSGWLYFPLRQIIWQRITRRPGLSKDRALRDLVNTLFSSATEAEVIRRWPILLARTFQPLELNPIDDRLKAPQVTHNGTCLLIPPLNTKGKALCLTYPDAGGRLYSQDDILLANLLLTLAGKALQGLQARVEGAQTERKRIMGDLHDDIGARLLDLVYAAEELPKCRKIALAVIEDLRGLVDASTNEPVKLNILALGCEGEARKRLADAVIGVTWARDDLPDTQVSARAASNIQRMLREAITNVIRHAQALNVAVVWRVDANHLIISVTDNGTGNPPNRWHQEGHGTRTLRLRSGQLGGQVRWLANTPSGCRLVISLPLPL